MTWRSGKLTVALISGLLCVWFSVPVHAGSKNIILIIGDGMGVAAVSAARLSMPQFPLDQFPVVGLVATQSQNSFLTDSAAAATAYATGKKTYNRRVSLGLDGKPLKTVFEHAAEQGMVRGVVTTSRVTHATPAAFVSHVEHRKYEARVAEQFVQGGVEVVIGGGRDCIVENNIFVECMPALHIDSRAMGWASGSVNTTMKDRLLAMPYKDPLWAERYPELVNILDDEPAAPKGNIIARNVCYGGRWDEVDNRARPYVTFINNLVKFTEE